MWRWVFVGAPASQQYVIEHPFNHSQSECGMQTGERWLGLRKWLSERKGNKDGPDLIGDANIMDVYGMCAIGYDQVESSKFSNSNFKGGNTRLEWDITGKNTYRPPLLQQMPNQCSLIMQDLFAIKFGDISSISDRLMAPFANNGHWDNTCKIISNDLNIRYVSRIFENNEIIIEYENLDRKCSRNDIFRSLQSKLQGTEEDDTFDESGLNQ